MGMGSNDNGCDYTRGHSRKNVVPVNLAPIIAVRRLSQMMGMPVYLRATIPVVMGDVATLPPFFVMNIVLVIIALTALVSVGLIVMVILSDERQTANAQGECGYHQSSTKGLHVFSSGFRFCCVVFFLAGQPPLIFQGNWRQDQRYPRKYIPRREDLLAGHALI